MSKTVAQIYATNPTTVVADTDLYYLVQSPYTPGTDAAISGASLKAVFGGGGTINPGLINQLGYYAASGSAISGLATLASGTLITSAGGVPSISQTLPSIVQGNITSLGTITSGAWNGTVITGTFGGTGVNNGASTITLGGSLTTSGAFASTFTMTNTTSVTFPTSGTLATTAQLLASPLTTKGDIWVWTTTNARLAVATGDGKILQVSSGAASGLAYSTPTYPSASGASGAVLISDATNYVASTSLWPNTVGTSGKVVISNGTSNVYSTPTFPNASSASGIFMISDGTNWVPSTSTIPTSAGATANKILLSNGTNYVLSTPTFPNASATSGKITQSDGTNWIASSATWPTAATSGKIIFGNGTNYVESTPTYPNASATTRKIIVSDGTNFVASTETWAVPGSSGNILTSDGTNWTSAAASTSLPAGTLFNFQATTLNTTVTVTGGSYADITGLSVAITPTSSSNKVLVRAVIQFGIGSAVVTPGFQLVRGSTAIGIGASAGSRTLVGSSVYNATAGNTMATTILEWLDSPATTSSTTYKVQCLDFSGNSGTVYLNRSTTDANAATSERAASMISVCEVHS